MWAYGFRNSPYHLNVVHGSGNTERHENCKTNFEPPRDHFLGASNGVPMDKGVIEGIVAGGARGAFHCVTCNHAVCCRPGHVGKLPDYQLPSPLRIKSRRSSGSSHSILPSSSAL